MIRMLLTLCMCLLAVMLIWGEGRDAAPLAARPQAAPLAAQVQPAAYTRPEPSTGLPLVLPLVAEGMVTPQPTEGPVTLRYITAATVNVREGPSTEYPVIGRLSRGEATRLLWQEENGWARITLEGDGMTGFVSGAFLSETAP